MDTVMELEIGPGPDPGSYVVHVLRSVGGGEPTETFHLDLDELVDRRPALEASVLLSSVSARRVMSDTEAAIQAVGRRLFEAAFTGEVYAAYRTSVAVASERGRGVQISLRLTAPGLAALPWEALFDPATETYLCRKEPLVRQVPAPHSPAALAIDLPLRVLAMVSSPRGLPALDVEHERELLEEALRPHLDAGRVQIEWLEPVSWARVHDKLLEQEWHVLHFIGHGTYDVETDEGVLAFVGRDGRAEYVSASSLADLLDEAEPTPRLILLNSCRSGAGGTDDLFSGTAAALAHSGIHAVAAMQFSISDTAAIEFARGFYSALAHGRGIDEAVRSGRIGILGLGRGTLEWVTPVLYLRGEDTRLFDVATAVDAPESARAPASVGSPRTRAPRGPRADRAPRTASTRSDRSSRPLKPWLIGGGLAVAAVAGALIALAFLPRGTDGIAGSGDPGSGGDSPTSNQVTVPMGTDWTATGVSCEAGDSIHISARGEATYDESGTTVGPAGIATDQFVEQRVYTDIFPFALMGRLDNRSDAFPVYNEQTYGCPQPGELLLGPNDNVLDDNDGGFTATVTLIPAG
ncbi:CHAT domain-containing protein [Agromyces sp. NPDC058484]|uniref:CHAT domain-containing protein n=1 Tax=Agromyces sp. NPDC058484 TaxID=3346524 RepID=UPI00366460F0